MNTIQKAKDDILNRLEGMTGEYAVVARAVGVDPSTIAKMVKAGVKSNPRINMVIALHDYLFSHEPSVGQATGKREMKRSDTCQKPSVSGQMM